MPSYHDWLRLTKAWLLACLKLAIKAPSLILLNLVEIWLDRGTEIRCSNLNLWHSCSSSPPFSYFNRRLLVATLPEYTAGLSGSQTYLDTSLASFYLCLLLNMPRTCWVDMSIRSSYKQWPLHSCNDRHFWVPTCITSKTSY